MKKVESFADLVAQTIDDFERFPWDHLSGSGAIPVPRTMNSVIEDQVTKINEDNLEYILAHVLAAYPDLCAEFLAKTGISYAVKRAQQMLRSCLKAAVFEKRPDFKEENDRRLQALANYEPF